MTASSFSWQKQNDGSIGSRLKTLPRHRHNPRSMVIDSESHFEVGGYTPFHQADQSGVPLKKLPRDGSRVCAAGPGRKLDGPVHGDAGLMMPQARDQQQSEGYTSSDRRVCMQVWVRRVYRGRLFGISLIV